VVSAKTALVQVTATDANGISRITIQGDSAVLNAGKYEKSVVLIPGINTISVVAQDASLKKNIDSLVFTLNCDTTAADNTPPEITLVSPANGSRVASASQLVQVTVKDQSGIASVTIGGKPASLVADKYQVQVNLNPGSNTINVSAEDASANKNKGQLTFALVYDSTLADSVPPAIRLNAPLSGQTFNKASLQVSATVTDSSGVSSVTINGGTPTSAGNDYTSTLTLVPGQNQITIVAIDASTRRNQKTAAITVFYDPPPESAILAVPSAVTFSSVKLMWSRSQDSDFVSYKVYHSTTPGVTQSDILDTTITNPVYYTCTIYKLLENTTYYFKVFTEDRFPSVTPGNEVSAKTSWITPQVPTLFLPADGAVHTPVPTTLVWNLAADASSYHVQISTSPSFASGNTDSAGITGTSIMFQSPLFNTKYYWHVCAVHGDSSSAWSIARTFSTALAPPSAPTLKSPANGSTVQNSTQKLLWLKPDTTVNGYWVQVSTNSSFSSVDVLDQNSVGAESLMVSGLTSGKTFYWHVRATNPDASSAWSAISSFSVQPLIWTNISAGGSGLTKTDVRSVAVKIGRASCRERV
jgi:hypothetical protein